MRYVRWILFVAACAAATTASAATDDHYTGISLETPYPTETLQLKDDVNIPLTVHNYGLAPQVIDVSVEDLPQGWEAHLKGENHDVAAAFVGTDDSRSLSLHIKPGPDASPGTVYHLRLNAAGTDTSAMLPLSLSFTHAPPASLKLETDLPKLKGSSSATFTYHLSLRNDSDKDVNANLTADAPDGFEVNFSPQFGSNDITSLPVKAGETKKVDAKISAPRDAKANAYPVEVAARAGDLSTSATLTAVITGKPELSLGTPSGQLSGSAYAGKTTAVNLVLHNTGSAPAHDVRLSASSPTHWKVAFHPDQLPLIPPDGQAKVVADVDPAQQSLAGDYMVTFTADAQAGAADANADYRVTVSTSTSWGLVGVVIVAIALLVVGFAVARYGRR